MICRCPAGSQKERMGVMDVNRQSLAALLAVLLMLLGCSGENEPTSRDIPVYPNAYEGEAMQQGGMVGANLAQHTTTDGYDDVIDFYNEELARYNPQKLSHTSELGRQTAFSIPKKTGVLSVAVQEFTSEGTVNITIMGMGE